MSTQVTFEQTLRLETLRFALLELKGPNGPDVFQIDLEPHYGAAIGNVYDYANAGLMLRAGLNTPADFGPLRLDPGLPGSNFFEPTKPFSAYVFAGIDARAVGHNIFLDGNTFRDGPSVDKNVFVGDLLFGWAVAYDRFRVAFTHVIRTREYKTQASTEQFGAVSLTARF